MFTKAECKLKEKANSKLRVVGFILLFKTWTHVCLQPAFQPELRSWLHMMESEGLHRPRFWGDCSLLTAYFSCRISTVSYLSYCFFTVPIYFLPRFHVLPGLCQKTIKEKEQDFCIFWCILAKIFITTEQKLYFLELSDLSCLTSILIHCNCVSQYHFKTT